MATLSKRHHYLPVFFIKGFISPQVDLWVYNIENDKISDRTIAPKSIFYEWNQNNIIIDGITTDFLETQIYKYWEGNIIDNLREIQSGDLNKIEHQDYINRITLMITITFFRIPATRSWATRLTSNAEGNLPPNRKEVIEKIYSLPLNEFDKAKIINGIAFAINFEAAQFPTGKRYYKIIETKQTNFILSDNPIIYENMPSDFNGITNSCIFPLSEKRVYYGLKNKQFTFNTEIGNQINTLLALQSQQYFASPNKTVLEHLVAKYKELGGNSEYLQKSRGELFSIIKS